MDPRDELDRDIFGVDYYDPQDVDDGDWPIHEDQGELFEQGAYDDPTGA